MKMIFWNYFSHSFLQTTNSWMLRRIILLITIIFSERKLFLNYVSCIKLLEFCRKSKLEYFQEIFIQTNHNKINTLFNLFRRIQTQGFQILKNFIFWLTKIMFQNSVCFKTEDNCKVILILAFKTWCFWHRCERKNFWTFDHSETNLSSFRPDYSANEKLFLIQDNWMMNTICAL
jgi:hypothetical protein